MTSKNCMTPVSRTTASDKESARLEKIGTRLEFELRKRVSNFSITAESLMEQFKAYKLHVGVIEDFIEKIEEINKYPYLFDDEKCELYGNKYKARMKTILNEVRVRRDAVESVLIDTLSLGIGEARQPRSNYEYDRDGGNA